MATENSEDRTPAPFEVTVSSAIPDWDHYLASDEAATLFHDPRWGPVFDEAYGNRPYYLTARRDGDVAGVLLLIRQKNLVFGSHLCSLPYFDASGPLAKAPQAITVLMDEAEKLRSELKVPWAEVRCDEAMTDDMPCREDKVTLRLPLPEDADQLWEDFKPKVRNQVRKAEKKGLTFHADEEVSLDEFHGLYVRNMRDLGSPPHSERFFRVIREHFPEAARLSAVRRGDEPLAASFTMTDNHAARVPWAASDWRHRKLNANMLLYWGMLKEACESGTGCFDFGRSTRDSGTHRFKKQWGAEDVPLHWYFLLPGDQEIPKRDPESGRYRVLTGLWRRLPLGVVRRLGPVLISGLS